MIALHSKLPEKSDGLKASPIPLRQMTLAGRVFGSGVLFFRGAKNTLSINLLSDPVRPSSSLERLLAPAKA
jgi:hypothetical protein